MFFHQIRLKMSQKGYIMVQKGLKRQKIEFWDLELGDTPPPLTDNHCTQKSLAERGGTPSPPLTGKIRYHVFDRFPYNTCEPNA